MTANAPAPNPTAQLLQYRSQLLLHQAIAAVAKFGVADLLERGIHATSGLAQELALNEDALYRTLRALAAQGIFEETSPRLFRNTPLSNPLRSDVPQSVRALFIFSGSEFCARPFQEFASSLQTGIASRHMLSRHGLVPISGAKSRTRQNFRRRHDSLHQSHRPLCGWLK